MDEKKREVGSERKTDLMFVFVQIMFIIINESARENMIVDLVPSQRFFLNTVSAVWRDNVI